jgi:cytidylate kinase
VSARKLVIAIDGPAASGKSTTARLVAQRLGYLHLDTGAMYRALAVRVVDRGLDPSDAGAVTGLAEAARIELVQSGESVRVVLDGEDVTDRIRSQEVTRATSALSTLPGVRAVLVREQRRLGAGGGVVLEGRDIGTVVFPDADLKVYLTAGLDARALRRRRELAATGVEMDVALLREELEERDRRDSSRAVSPLRKAEDAVELDTSGMTVEEQVDAVLRLAARVQNGKG